MTTVIEAPPAPPPLRRRTRPAAVVLVGGIASLPMLMPAGLAPGPGNTGLPDVALVGLIATALVWAGTRGLPVRWPFLIPTLMTIIAGGIAAVVNEAGALTLIKDMFVLLWAVGIANLGRDPALLRVALRAFVRIGTCYAAVMIVGFVLGIDALSGKQIDGERAMFTFGDANYASNWFICVFFVARATRHPRSRGRRWAVCGILLAAELLTGSNGGLLALCVAVLLGCLFRLFREGRAHHAIAVGLFAVFVGGAGVTVVTQVDVQPFLDHASQTSPILRDSIGRTTGESTNSRGTVLATTLQMIDDQTHPWGIGPGQTERQMLVRQETYVREAHNDYVAAVLERGFLGGAALVVLVFVLVLKCVRIARRDALTGEYARLVPRPELFGALVAVFLVSGLFYETLHYRHGWAIFGLIAALDLFGRGDGSPGRRRIRPHATAPTVSSAVRRPQARRNGAAVIAPRPASGLPEPEAEGGAGRTRRRLLALVAGNVAGRVGALASLGVATVLVARIGGPELVGAFTLVRILPGLLCQLSSAGLPGAAPFFLARGDYDQSRVRPTLAWLTVIGATISGVGWLALSPLVYLVFFKSFGLWVAVAAAAPSFTQGFVSVGKGLLQGTDDQPGASLAIAVEEFVFLPIYLVLLTGWYGPGALISGLVLADVAAAAWIIRRLARRGFFAGWGRPDRRLGRSIAGYGLRGYLGQLIDLLQLRFDMALLGALAGPKVLGVYTVASKFAELVQLPGLAVNYILYPDFAKEDRDTATRRTSRLILPALGVSALAALPLALVAGTALPWVFGDVFDDAVVPTYIRLAGVVTFGVTGLVMAYLYGVGRPGAASAGQGLGLAVVVVLGALLIPAHGATGAAVATSVSFVATTAALLVWFRRVGRTAPAPPAPEDKG
ncbi:O-antigen ligase family protein [Actinomadura mexicana]|uniref:Membrane protein involved in the export of O-antigen and teichoic acid n=1 Tax=Actinomadura mexicana TaxID=134959 RepID=A0A238V3Q7_9ACTN|nr:O-antigen ligase family protein [Actinomadura mexicana]SNR28647.1 Membrane protein involved in the export of O-antigen and teichoic acid [Actinomadura mexicana]